jgi:hypothetical protein
MKAIEVVVEGALTEDGQLVLDEKPNLPPGRVKVWLQPSGQQEPAQETLWGALEGIHRAQQARGFKGRSLAEAVAEVRALRDEWDEDA